MGQPIGGFFGGGHLGSFTITTHAEAFAEIKLQENVWLVQQQTSSSFFSELRGFVFHGSAADGSENLSTLWDWTHFWPDVSTELHAGKLHGSFCHSEGKIQRCKKKLAEALNRIRWQDGIMFLFWSNQHEIKGFNFEQRALFMNEYILLKNIAYKNRKYILYVSFLK